MEHLLKDFINLNSNQWGSIAGNGLFLLMILTKLLNGIKTGNQIDSMVTMIEKVAIKVSYSTHVNHN